jgi:hypothetical protein
MSEGNPKTTFQGTIHGPVHAGVGNQYNAEQVYAPQHHGDEINVNHFDLHMHEGATSPGLNEFNKRWDYIRTRQYHIVKQNLPYWEEKQLNHFFEIELRSYWEGICSAESRIVNELKKVDAQMWPRFIGGAALDFASIFNPLKTGPSQPSDHMGEQLSQLTMRRKQFEPERNAILKDKADVEDLARAAASERERRNRGN